MADNTGAKVLYISYDGMTDPLGQSQVIPYLSGLSKLGHHITLLSFEKAEKFSKAEKHIRQLLSDNNIHWVHLPYTKKPPVLSTLWDVWQMQKKATQLHRQYAFNIVHCRSYISSLVGLVMKKRYGLRFVFDMRGFYADERVDGKVWNLGNPLFKAVYRFFKSKEKEFLAAADQTVSLTYKAADIIHTWKEIEGQPVPIEVIPCCADLDHFDYHRANADKQQQIRKQLGIPGDAFVLSYLGSVGTWYMLPEMMLFFKRLLHRQPNARFLFITTDAPDLIKEAAAKAGVADGKVVITPANRAQLPDYLMLSNWSIFFIKPVFSKLASSPTKQAEIMGMGIPHVCNAGVGDQEQVFAGNSQLGCLISSFEEKAIDAALDVVLDRGYIANREAIRARAGDWYSLQKGIEKYALIYKRLTDAGISKG